MKDKRPNIILITTDHLRRDSIGIYGNNIIRTPNIDKLARNGTIFTNAYTACPLCMPSRNSIITGLYPHQHGICGNKGQPVSMEHRRLTFSNILQESGYTTAFIGKHHFYDFWEEYRDYREIEEQIKDYGFNKVIQVVDLSENLHNDCDFTAYLKKKGLLEKYRSEAKNLPLFESNFAPEDTVDGFVGNRCVEYIQDTDTDSPFFLWSSFLGPHPPYTAPGEFSQMYDPQDMPSPIFTENSAVIERAKRARAKYYGMVSHIDHHVGRMIKVLKKRGILENTLIILTSDHGDTLGDRGHWDKRRFYESSVGVPLIISGPGFPCGGLGSSTGGMKSRILTENIDLYATVLNTAGLEIPETRIPLSGRSMQSMITNRYENIRNAVFSEMGQWIMIRDARWKLTYDPEQGGVRMLFNMATDPYESDNLCGKPEYRDVEYQLVSRILNWLIRTSTYTQYKEYQRIKDVVSS
ncbi:sulfatase-like hydrolase/transferase [Candidatus Poribacteria bacterium]|nr:sulfatase-like hydrolase/transferase [Candidatus Poribacteria bacterium]